jgi:hypothetical protein
MDLNIETFLAMLGRYNQELWPLQIVSYILAILCLFLALKPSKTSSKVISAVLSFYWLWTGIVFGILYWGPTYTPAYLFSVLLIIQGILFFASGVLKARLSFQFKLNPYSVLGLIVILYALGGYQVFGYFIGHRYPVFFASGLVPCPTNAFTVGMLLWTARKFPKHLLIIPFLWSLSGFMPVSKGILEDIGMILFGLSGVLLILIRDRKSSSG